MFKALHRARLWSFLWLLLWALMPPAALAQPTSETRVKARLTANLARFSQWPVASFQSPNDAVVFCVVHKSPSVAIAFQDLIGLALGARAVRVQSNPSSLQGCHVLYVEADAERAASVLLGAQPPAGLLTVGDGAEFAQHGMVSLVNVNDAIRFDVNLGRLRRGQLDLSSQALRLARRVED
jgi:hypothetical protein